MLPSTRRAAFRPPPYDSPFPLFSQQGRQRPLVRAWLYAEDHVDALLLAATCGELGRGDCVGGHGEPGNNQVVEAIGQLLEQRCLDGAPLAA